jgi:4-alpha-glucanotransferase
MQFQFYLRYHTSFGQSLYISGNTAELGDNNFERALPMEYLNNEFWHISIDIRRKDLPAKVTYKYLLKNDNGEIVAEWGDDRSVSKIPKEVSVINFTDTWNHAGEYENAFMSAPFSKVLLKENTGKTKDNSDKSPTHIFRVKAPLIQKNEVVCLTGSGEKMEEWNEINPLLLAKEGNWWTIGINLSGTGFPLTYKYGVYNTQDKKFVRFEDGNNRILYSDASSKKLSIAHDGFVQLPNTGWKGTGIAIPVFSLRSAESFGVGEFSDIKKLADWSAATGLKLIQLLPVNDTIATHTWEDSYPYAAISAFALHPLYINIFDVAGKTNAGVLDKYKSRQETLNQLAAVDYEAVMEAKLEALKELYQLIGDETFESAGYKKFLKANKHWLIPYAAFCFFRDKYGHSRFAEWPSNSEYDKDEIAEMFSAHSSVLKEISFFLFVQFHLHSQLKDAADYARKNGVVMKGDIPIGIYRNGCDAWISPGLYNMEWQAGAPPDDFTAVGQNWGFPTYNWKRMQEDGFAWWKQRFEQMSNYFDAFRIDHILGFFRIWSIPINAVQGMMGRFVPCIPVHITEFGEKGIWFDYKRYCRPFITDEVLSEQFGELADRVKNEFVIADESGGYELALKFETQRQIADHFETEEKSAENERLKNGLLDLVANVILFDEEGSQGQQFHFRFGMEKTITFRHLIPHVQEKLRGLYIDYFFKRQDDFWAKEAMHKLPWLKAATNMLICGEDLGMVPECVPDVMKQLGILSLEIQRMPKDPKKEFFHPNDAPYMSVITPSTHDMSTIRGWWEENRETTQKFYNNVMGQWGDAPFYCEPWINRAIIMQHLYSPAMWSIFMLQDLLGMSEKLRRDNPADERINNPANPKHYWRYRMHISLEDLISQEAFNSELKDFIANSSRS